MHSLHQLMKKGKRITIQLVPHQHLLLKISIKIMNSFQFLMNFIFSISL